MENLETDDFEQAVSATCLKQAEVIKQLNSAKTQLDKVARELKHLEYRTKALPKRLREIVRVAAGPGASAEAVRALVKSKFDEEMQSARSNSTLFCTRLDQAKQIFDNSKAAVRERFQPLHEQFVAELKTRRDQLIDRQGELHAIENAILAEQGAQGLNGRVKARRKGTPVTEEQLQMARRLAETSKRSNDMRNLADRMADIEQQVQGIDQNCQRVNYIRKSIDCRISECEEVESECTRSLRTIAYELSQASESFEGILASESDEVQREQQQEAIKTAIDGPWTSIFHLQEFQKLKPPSLGESDSSLVALWTKDCGSNQLYWQRAMESARTAELVALEVYRMMYGSVEDLSILQVNCPSDDRWKNADLSVLENRSMDVDVKNSRRSFSSPDSYSEHCVPRFKCGRHGDDVVLSGFLSPYNAENRIHSGPILWLGETTLAQIKSLSEQFVSEYLTIDFSDCRGTLLPPWVFDYPNVCYAKRNRAIELIRSSDSLLNNQQFPYPVKVLAHQKDWRPHDSDHVEHEGAAMMSRFGDLANLCRPGGIVNCCV